MNPHRTEILEIIIIPLILALVFQFLAWSWMRTVRGSRPPTPFMTALLRYGFFGALGMCYMIAVGSIFAWPERFTNVIAFVWFLSSGMFAYWRSRSKGEMTAREKKNSRTIWAQLSQALLFLSLVISLIGTALEAEASLKGLSELRSHLVRSILYPCGIVIAIVLARQQRRAVTVTALRVFLGWLVIGGLTRPGLSGFSVAALAGSALFILLRYVRASPPLENIHEAPHDSWLRS